MSKPEEKPKRKMVALSTKLSAMAAIEQIMNSLPWKDQPAVVGWFIAEYQRTSEDPTRDSAERG